MVLPNDGRSDIVSVAEAAPIKSDPQRFKDDVESYTGASCVVLAPGEVHTP